MREKKEKEHGIFSREHYDVLKSLMSICQKFYIIIINRQKVYTYVYIFYTIHIYIYNKILYKKYI